MTNNMNVKKNNLYTSNGGRSKKKWIVVAPGYASVNGLAAAPGYASVNGLAAAPGYASVNGLAAAPGYASVNGLAAAPGYYAIKIHKNKKLNKGGKKTKRIQKYKKRKIKTNKK